MTGKGVFYALLRYGIAFVLLIYGFGKLTGAQFTILDSELAKPMGEVSGFWLTWYYFSYSSFYGGFVALSQIAGAILLFFRRTTLLGACVLAPIVSNIVLIDIFYRIDAGALTMALLLLLGLGILLGFHAGELRDVFWTHQNSVLPAVSSTGFLTAVKWALRGGMVVVTALFSYWVANYNNRVPTPIDGAWTVVRVDAASLPGKVPGMIFFERNRAHLCVFRFEDGSSEEHHFEIDRANQSIGIWQKWRSKGERIFEGSYDLAGARLSLQGLWDGGADVRVALQKK